MEGKNSFRDVLKEKYGFSGWSKKLTASAMQEDFLADNAAFPDFFLEKRSAFPGVRHAYQDYYRSKKDNDVCVAVTVTVHISVSDAHEGLLNILSTAMSPQVPRVEEKGISVGDIAYAGSGDVQTSVWFVRGNVVVELNSVGNKPYSVVAFAELIDRQLMAGRDTKK